jgi:hypothetical protein
MKTVGTHWSGKRRPGDASSKKRVFIQGTHRLSFIRDVLAQGRNIQDFSFGATSVGDDIHFTLKGCPSPSPPARLDKTPVSVVFLAPLSSVVRILQSVPLSPCGMTWRKYKLLILPNASFSDGLFQAYCTVCLVAKTGIVNKTD